MSMLLMIHHYKTITDWLSNGILVYMLNKDNQCHNSSLIPANAHVCSHAKVFFSQEEIMLRWEGLSSFKHCCPDWKGPNFQVTPLRPACPAKHTHINHACINTYKLHTHAQWEITFLFEQDRKGGQALLMFASSHSRRVSLNSDSLVFCDVSWNTSRADWKGTNRSSSPRLVTSGVTEIREDGLVWIFLCQYIDRTCAESSPFCFSFAAKGSQMMHSFIFIVFFFLTEKK